MDEGDPDAGVLADLRLRLQVVAATDRGIADAIQLIPDDTTAFWRSQAQAAFARRLTELAERLALARVALDRAQSLMRDGIDRLGSDGVDGLGSDGVDRLGSDGVDGLGSDGVDG